MRGTIATLMAASFLGLPPLAWTAEKPPKQSNQTTMADKRATAALIIAYEMEAARIFRINAYHGTRVYDSPRIPAPPGFIDRMTKADQSPQARLDYFSWLAEHRDIKRQGWNLSVVGVAPSASGVLVKVVVDPVLIGTEGGESVFTMAKFEEVYEHAANGTYFVEGRALTPKGSALMYP